MVEVVKVMGRCVAGVVGVMRRGVLAVVRVKGAMWLV